MTPTVEDTALAIKILGYGADGPATERAAKLIAEYREIVWDNAREGMSYSCGCC